MSTSSTTVVLLVPGAWHAPDHYSQLLDGLKHEGFQTVSQRNPSCDSTNPHETSTAGDASAIRHVILSQIAEGHDVVVAMHSYGGCPGAAAAHGLSKTERQAAGRQGGVIGLIFICAFVANEGDSLIGKLPGGVRTEWMILHPDGQIFPENPKDVFYEDVPSPEDSVAISQLRLQSNASLDNPSPPPAWKCSEFDGRRSYMYCLKDKAIPYMAQKAMIQASGVDWNLGTLECAHSPFLSHPAKLTAWVAEEVRAFQAAL